MIKFWKVTLEQPATRTVEVLVDASDKGQAIEQAVKGFFHIIHDDYEPVVNCFSVADAEAVAEPDIPRHVLEAAKASLDRGAEVTAFTVDRNQPLPARLPQLKDKDGYLWVVLERLDGEPVLEYVHLLTAKTWLPNPDRKPNVRHRNGVITDNRVENLEWCD